MECLEDGYKKSVREGLDLKTVYKEYGNWEEKVIGEEQSDVIWTKILKVKCIVKGYKDGKGVWLRYNE